MKGGTKSKVFSSSLHPGDGAHSRALKAENFLVGGGAVVTNDCCIISLMWVISYSRSLHHIATKVSNFASY